MEVTIALLAKDPVAIGALKWFKFLVHKKNVLLHVSLLLEDLVASRLRTLEGPFLRVNAQVVQELLQVRHNLVAVAVLALVELEECLMQARFGHRAFE